MCKGTQTSAFRSDFDNAKWKNKSKPRMKAFGSHLSHRWLPYCPAGCQKGNGNSSIPTPACTSVIPCLQFKECYSETPKLAPPCKAPSTVGLWDAVAMTTLPGREGDVRHLATHLEAKCLYEPRTRCLLTAPSHRDLSASLRRRPNSQALGRK